MQSIIITYIKLKVLRFKKKQYLTFLDIEKKSNKQHKNEHKSSQQERFRR